MLSANHSLKGKEVVLAGGAGGLGAAVASLLVEEGARLVVSYHHNRERAEAFAPAARIVHADLRSEQDRRDLLDAAPGLYGLVVLVGDPVRVKDSSQIEPAMHLSHEVNYLGPILLAREAANRMQSSQSPGAIVLVSTMQANALFPGSTVYAAQKAALQHAARILAKERRGAANIRVNVVSPGIIAAGMAQASIASGKYAHFIEQGVIGRFGRAEDVARAIRFLLEPDNYVNGQVLCVDGGLTL